MRGNRFQATYLDVQENGLRLDLNVLKAAINPDTVVVSVMFVNNELAWCNIAEIGELCREKGIIFHVGPRPRPLARLPSIWLALRWILIYSAPTEPTAPRGWCSSCAASRVRLEAQFWGWP